MSAAKWVTEGFALGWVVRSTVHWLGWIGRDGVRQSRAGDAE